MFKLKLRDFLKGLIIAVGTPVLYMLQELIPHWNLDPIYKAAISAGITYLIKNWLTDDIKMAQNILSEAKVEGIKAAEPIPPPLEKVDISKFPPSGTVPTSPSSSDKSI